MINALGLPILVMPGSESDETVSDDSLQLWLWSTGGVQPAIASQLLEAVQQGSAVAWVLAEANHSAVRGELVRLGLPRLGADVLDRLLHPPSPDEQLNRSDGVDEVVATLAKIRSNDAGHPSLEQWPVRIAAGRRWVLVLIWRGSVEAEPPDIHRLANPGWATEIADAQDVALQSLLGVAGTLDVAALALDQLLRSTPSEAVVSAIARVVDELQLLVAEIRRPGRDPDTAWFVEADNRKRGRGLVELLDAVDRRLTVLSRDASRRVTDYRAELERRQAKANQRLLESERRQAEANQRVLGTLAALLLGPSFVASLLNAFPDWLPSHQRGDAMLGLSIATAGAIWIVVTLVSLRSGRLYWGPILGALAMAVGLVIGWPLDAGSDGQAPELAITCPTRPLVGRPAFATVIASDAEDHLRPNPSGSRRLKTSSVGVHFFTVRVADSFGNASTASCAYRVVRGRQNRR